MQARFDPQSEGAVSVLAPPPTTRRSRARRDKLIPAGQPPQPPDFFDGFDGFGGDPWGDGSPQPERREPQSNDTARFGLLLAMLASSVMFAVFVGAYVLLTAGEAASPTRTFPSTTWIATSLLLVSTLTISRAVTCNESKRPNQARAWVYATLALGVAFLVAQVLLWMHLAQAGELPRSGPGVTLFWALTSLHAGHVVLGLFVLARVIRRQELSHITVAGEPLLGLAASYWHFIGLLWTCLFAALFLVR